MRVYVCVCMRMYACVCICMYVSVCMQLIVTNNSNNTQICKNRLFQFNNLFSMYPCFPNLFNC